MKRRMKQILLGMLLAIFMICIPASEASAASSLALNVNGKDKVYTGTQVKFTLNGKNIDLHGTPGIVISNNSMGYYVDIFKNALKADCYYDKQTKKLTITKFDKTVSMSLGKKVAYINGKKKKMEAPMMMVRYKAAKKNRIMVPVGFVAQNLGYTYKWNNSTKTGQITSNWMELNIDGMWMKYTGTKVKASYNKKNISYGKMPGIVIDNTALLNGKKVFEKTLGATCTYDKVEDSITVSKDNVTIVYTVDSNVALVNGIEQTVDVTAQRIKNRATGKYYLMVPGRFTAMALGYYYNWNSKTKTSEITDTVVSQTANVASDASIYFSLPAFATGAAVTDTDCYYNNQFMITVNSDISSHLQVTPLVVNNPVVTGYDVQVSGGNTILTFTTSKLQGYKVTVDNGMVAVKVGEPKDVYSNIVVLDCGHGGTDPGAQAGGYKEADLNYAMLYTCAKKYFDSSTSKVKAYWTRYNDTFISLDDRAAFASAVGADLFVSLHMNSATSSASGTEVYYSSNNNTTLQNGLNSNAMAGMYLSSVVSTFGSKNRGVKTANYVVIKKNTVPAVLIELGFISNDGDRAKLVDPTMQENVAKAIYDTTESVFEKYPTGRQ